MCSRVTPESEFMGMVSLLVHQALNKQVLFNILQPVFSHSGGNTICLSRSALSSAGYEVSHSLQSKSNKVSTSPGAILRGGFNPLLPGIIHAKNRI